MANNLFTLRTQLRQISPLLKQKKYFSVVQVLREAATLLENSEDLLKKEIEEIDELLIDGSNLLAKNEYIRQIFPLQISYSLGSEQGFLEVLGKLAEALQAETTKNLPMVDEVLEKKDIALTKGQDELDAGKIDEARQTFAEIVEEFPEDDELAADVGERFMEKGLYEDATGFFTSSLAAKPNSSNVYNRLGIALRKIKRFEAAEENFLKVLAIEKKDPHVYFNLGRLYLEWGKWEESIKYANQALVIDPDFVQAAQLKNYALRMKEKA